MDALYYFWKFLVSGTALPVFLGGLRDAAQMLSGGEQGESG